MPGSGIGQIRHVRADALRERIDDHRAGDDAHELRIGLRLQAHVDQVVEPTAREAAGIVADAVDGFDGDGWQDARVVVFALHRARRERFRLLRTEPTGRRRAPLPGRWLGDRPRAPPAAWLGETAQRCGCGQPIRHHALPTRC